MVFTTNGYTIMSRLIEGEFLNYKQVIPEGSRSRVVVDCKQFIDTIERASLIITERLKNPLRITFAPDKITVRCQTTLGRVMDEFPPEKMGATPSRSALTTAICWKPCATPAASGCFWRSTAP